jgi:hypothetical protein
MKDISHADKLRRYFRFIIEKPGKETGSFWLLLIGILFFDPNENHRISVPPYHTVGQLHFYIYFCAIIH